MEKKEINDADMNFKGNSCFIISLDFELHWGGFEKWNLGARKNYYLATREIIPPILKAFERSGVHATWATVGLLLFERKEDLINNFPRLKPTYDNIQLSAFNYILKDKIGSDENSDQFHYGKSLVKKILGAAGQELGSHSFAHYYCNEPGQTVEQFKADALAWNKASTANGYHLKADSLVFPRNQFNNSYLKVCKDVGIKVVRTNPIDWWWNIQSTANESIWKRFNRGLDAYFDIGGKTSFSLVDIEKREGVWLLPASRLLRPYNPKELFLNSKKIGRIKKEMTIAAVSNECYHLWWHPHNFGNYSRQNLDGLSKILNHYTFLNKKYGMESKNMKELACILDNA
ncbi:MAG: polysaccharide deacetylase family protein [Bacteroidota bacterium]